MKLERLRLWQQQDKKQQAHKMLDASYHWFTEGFDMVDLQEAKALLDTLNRGPGSSDLKELEHCRGG